MSIVVAYRTSAADRTVAIVAVISKRWSQNAVSVSILGRIVLAFTGTCGRWGWLTGTTVAATGTGLIAVAESVTAPWGWRRARIGIAQKGTTPITVRRVRLVVPTAYVGRFALVSAITGIGLSALLPTVPLLVAVGPAVLTSVADLLATTAAPVVDPSLWVAHPVLASFVTGFLCG